MEQCKYCKQMYKHIVQHINRCPAKQAYLEIPGMTSCPYCQKMFKQLSGHLYRCPENTGNKQKSPPSKIKAFTSEDEKTDSKKNFIQIAEHIDRCPENGENKQKTSARKTKKTSSSGDEATDLSPCPHCKKDFKRLADHIYRCPEYTESKKETSAKKITKKASSTEDKATNLIPCPHCKKQFKWLGGHIYRCPENVESKQEISDMKITKKASSSEDKAKNLIPCPYCKKQFKRLAGHIYRCPENAESKQETSREMTKKKSSSEAEATDLILFEDFTSKDDDENDDKGNYDDDDEEEASAVAAATDMQLCPYCKKIFKRFEDPVFTYPVYSELKSKMPQKEITKNHLSSGNAYRVDFVNKKLEDVLDNTTHFNLSTDQSISASSLFDSSPSPQIPEFKMAHVREVASQLTCPPIHVDCISGTKQKKLEKIDPALKEPTPDYYSVNSCKLWETETEYGSTSMSPKKPQIHNEYPLQHGSHIVNNPGTDESDLTDSHEEIFFSVTRE